LGTREIRELNEALIAVYAELAKLRERYPDRAARNTGDLQRVGGGARGGAAVR
jgi:hypothetical protein